MTVGRASRRFAVDRLQVTADESGRLVGVTGLRHPDRPYLIEVDLAAPHLDGRQRSWTTREVVADADEMTVGLRSNGLEVTLRHSFTAGWTTRLLLRNVATAPLALPGLRLVVRAASGQRVSALAAGARACWAVQSCVGDGPLLTARLTAGSVSSIDDTGFELGPVRLETDQRYVVQWRWEQLATPRSVVAGPGRDVLVARTAYEVDEGVLLPDDPDAALVTPAEVDVDTVEEPAAVGREVSAAVPGRHRIELRSAEGDVRLDLSWVAPLAAQLAAWSERALAGPRTSSGIVVLDGLETAIVLQAAVGTGSLADPDQADDALDRVTSRLLDEGTVDGAAFAPLFLLGEHSRTGDPEVLDLALRRSTVLLARVEPAAPGLGLTLLRAVLAGGGSDQRVIGLVADGLARADRGLTGTDLGPDDELDARSAAAELELLLAVRPLLPPDHPAGARLTALVRRLGAGVGGGLPGRLLTPPSVAEHAYLVAVLRMLPEDGLPSVTRSWGAPPSLLAQRATLEVLDRLDDDAEDSDGAAAAGARAWLALSQRHV